MEIPFSVQWDGADRQAGVPACDGGCGGPRRDPEGVARDAADFRTEFTAMLIAGVGELPLCDPQATASTEPDGASNSAIKARAGLVDLANAEDALARARDVGHEYVPDDPEAIQTLRRLPRRVTLDDLATIGPQGQAIPAEGPRHVSVCDLLAESAVQCPAFAAGEGEPALSEVQGGSHDPVGRRYPVGRGPGEVQSTSMQQGLQPDLVPVPQTLSEAGSGFGEGSEPSPSRVESAPYQCAGRQSESGDCDALSRTDGGPAADTPSAEQPTRAPLPRHTLRSGKAMRVTTASAKASEPEGSKPGAAELGPESAAGKDVAAIPPGSGRGDFEIDPGRIIAGNGARGSVLAQEPITVRSCPQANAPAATCVCGGATEEERTASSPDDTCDRAAQVRTAEVPAEAQAQQAGKPDAALVVEIAARGEAPALPEHAAFLAEVSAATEDNPADVPASWHKTGVAQRLDDGVRPDKAAGDRVQDATAVNETEQVRAWDGLPRQAGRLVDASRAPIGDTSTPAAVGNERPHSTAATSAASQGSPTRTGAKPAPLAHDSNSAGAGPRPGPVPTAKAARHAVEREDPRPASERAPTRAYDWPPVDKDAALRSPRDADVQQPERPHASARSVIDQMVQRAELRLGESEVDMVIDLKPDALGRVHLKITAEAGRVTAEIRAENAATRSLIEAGLPDLKTALADRGLALEAIAVSADAGSKLAGNGARPRWFSEEPARDRTARTRSGAHEARAMGPLVAPLLSSSRVHVLDCMA